MQANFLNEDESLTNKENFFDHGYDRDAVFGAYRGHRFNLTIHGDTLDLDSAPGEVFPNHFLAFFNRRSDAHPPGLDLTFGNAKLLATDGYDDSFGLAISHHHPVELVSLFSRIGEPV